MTKLLDPDELEQYARDRRKHSRISAARDAFDRHRRASEAVRIHVGCGARILGDWLNVDLWYRPGWSTNYPDPEQRGGPDDFALLDVVRDGLPFPDDSVDVIFHEDFIEHLSQRDAVRFLAETYRVLRRNGGQRVSTPDLVWSMRQGSDFARGANGVHVDEWDRWGHKNVLTARYLEDVSELIGFSSVVRTERDASTIPGVPRDYRPGPHRAPEGNLYYDLRK